MWLGTSLYLLGVRVDHCVVHGKLNDVVALRCHKQSPARDDHSGYYYNHTAAVWDNLVPGLCLAVGSPGRPCCNLDHTVAAQNNQPHADWYSPYKVVAVGGCFPLPGCRMVALPDYHDICPFLGLRAVGGDS